MIVPIISCVSVFASPNDELPVDVKAVDVTLPPAVIAPPASIAPFACIVPLAVMFPEAVICPVNVWVSDTASHKTEFPEEETIVKIPTDVMFV